MTQSEDNPDNRHAAEYYNEKIQINESSNPYPDRKRNIADLYLLLAGFEAALINYPKAIEAYRDALEDYPLAWYPMEHTTLQLRLAQTYERLITVEMEVLDSIERVNAAGIEPIPVNPEDNDRWLEIRKGLAPVEHFIQAIEAYEAATLIKNPRTNSLDYGEIQHNIGMCYYRLLALEDPSINSKKAIEAFQEVLSVTNITVYPVQYAQTQLHLGQAYTALAREEAPAENCQLTHHPELFRLSQNYFQLK